MDNKNVAVKPAKKTRGDILHERMVLLGEIKPEKVFDKKKFFFTSLIILCVLIAAIVVLQYRLNVVQAYEDALYAQQAADHIVKSGIKAIWNFTNTPLSVPPEIIQQRVNMAGDLAELSVKLSGRIRNSGKL